MARAGRDSGIGGATPAHDALGLAVSVALYGLVVWAPAGMLPVGTLPLGSDVLSVVSSVAHALGLLAFGILVSAQALPRALAPALSVLSAVLWGVVAAVGPACPMTLALACAVVSGLAVAGGFVAWVGALSRMPERGRRATLALAAVIAAAFSLLAATPVSVRRVGSVALLAAQALLAARAPRPLAADGGGMAGVFGGAGASARGGRARVLASALAPVVATAVVVSFAAPLVNGVLMLDALPMASRAVISACMSLACGAALAVAWLLPRRVPSVLAILLGFTVLLFGAFVLNGIVGLHLSLVVLALGSAGYFLVLYVLMEACVAASTSSGAPVGLVYGVAGAVVMLARVVADEVSLRLLHAGVTEETKTLVAMFLMVYLLTCAGFALYHALTRPRRSEGAGSAAPAPEKPAERPATPAPAPAVDATTQRCERVAEGFGLSPRELQVLVLMMHGRNVPAIAEELSISRNTVQTHVRHVYEALGVHGRQELVTFVETSELR